MNKKPTYFKNLKETFSATIDSNFDNEFIIKVDQKIDSVDFSKNIEVLNKNNY